MNLVDQFLGFEVVAEEHYLPAGKEKQTGHGEDGQVEDTLTSGLCNLFILKRE